MANRNPTPEEVERAHLWARPNGPSLEQRLDLLDEILEDPTFDHDYKTAALDILRYYLKLVSSDPEDAGYDHLPASRRYEIEHGPSASTVHRYLSGKTQRLRPLTEIKLAIALGLPCLEKERSGS